MVLRDVSLKDKYELKTGVAFMSGLQALARIPLAQRARDIAAGLNTAGFISGYRGSPLGGFDRELVRAQKYLDSASIKFVPGVNEDLAATAVWGTQQVNLMPGATVDGVFGIWYGKAPGVDRSGDVMRHANANGTSPNGGVLAIFGDDHACKSSTLSGQSDHALYAMQIPQLYPANIQEFVEYGLLGIAMSRYSGCWTAMKVTSETVETSGTVDLAGEHREILIPDETEFKMPPGGVHIRLNDIPREIDARLQNYKLFACHAFARKNKIDRVIWDSPKPRFGIITSGKSYADVRQALEDMGITEDIARAIGLRLYKVGMTWPLEPMGVQNFVEGLEEILIVEEKREFIEYQLKQQVYNWEEGRRPPVIVGKYDEKGARLLPLHNEQSVGLVARVIAQRIERFYRTDAIENALKFYAGLEEKEKSYVPPILRRPWYCSGCPHNTSTKVPDGSFAMVGIGCHYMVQWMDRDSALCTQMGGEGVPWIGSAPFTQTKHIFSNLGDGTYFHSGTLAIRASVAAKVNITYKILYNDAVAMTGGQPVDGDLPVWRVAQQVMAEGVTKAWIVTENVGQYKDRSKIPSDVTIVGREWLPKIMHECRETAGTTVIIYDQTCAAEKRRRRKRGQYPDPAKRVVINSAVCEGCGDCSVQSNCISVQPLETEYGRKRQINQSMCNKDFSCVKGFCPSFVTIEGGALKQNTPAKSDNMFDKIPMPNIRPLNGAYNILVPGVGGTGVLTIGALLGMAAHVEGKSSAILDSTGLAQKGGEVLSHVRIASEQEYLHNAHIIAGGTDVVLACDMVSAVGRVAHETLNPEKTIAVVNTATTPVAAFVLDNDMDFHDDDVRAALIAATREQHFVDATMAVAVLLGDEMGTNMFMLGYAWQHGLIPLEFESIMRAVDLNNVAIDDNKKAFAFGRLAAHEPERLNEMIDAIRGKSGEDDIATNMDTMLAKRIEYLTAYQNAAYAARYANAVARFDAWPNVREAVIKNYHKLLAYKDEYEVARLYTNGDFIKSIRAQFDGKYRLVFNMAPPIMEKTDPATGRPKKRTFGPWMMGALHVLAKMKGLRGTMFDPFGGLKDRREERALITEYEAMMDAVLNEISPANAELCRDILALPDVVRGYGPVKDENIRKYRAQKAVLMERLRQSVKRAA